MTGRPRRGGPLRTGLRTGLMLGLASVTGVVAFAWPLLARPAGAIAQADTAPVVLGAVLVVVLAVVTVALDDGGMDAKAIAVLGLLSAVGTVLRPLSAGTAGVELVFLTIVLGGRAFGPAFGFALGSTTLAASALVTGGVGPWLPFQMLGASWVGMGAGLLPRGLRGRAEVVVLAAYGAAAAAAFGVAMNLSFWPFQLGAGPGLSFVAGDPLDVNLHRFGLYSLATSRGWDVGRAVTTAAGLALLGGPALRALRRTAARARFLPRSAAAADMPARPVGASREPVAVDQREARRPSSRRPGDDTPGLVPATRRTPV